MIYFDNAATGGFKPYSVLESVMSAVKYLSANPSRGAHRRAIAAAKLVMAARKEISEYFGNGSPDRVVFTKNCTEAMNTAIFGTVEKGMKVVTGVFEHNSVLRPLYKLERDGDITLKIVSPKLENGETTTYEQAILNAAAKGACDLVVMTAASNVTGAIFDFKTVGKELKNRGIKFIVDAAQAAGHVKIDMTECGIDVLCASGHKGLCGIMGSGVLVFTENIEISPLLYGGTGVETFNPDMPMSYPERLEGGTLALPNIVSLLEGVMYVKENTDYFASSLEIMTGSLIGKLKAMDKVIVYSKPNKTGVVSFNVEGMDSVTVGDILNEKYDIAVRCGFHCAPLCHKYLGTEDIGAIRASLAPQNTIREINTFCSAIKDIIGSES